MTAQETLEKVATGLVAVGLYKDVETAIRVLALEQIERKISTYQAQVREFEAQHHYTLEEYSRALTGKASMEAEETWMEWKGATVMLEAWRKALQEVLHGATST
jgi:hypothetical protein